MNSIDNTESKDKSPATWVARILFGAAAVATALTALITFWDHLFPPDVEDVATIERVEIIKQANLSDFPSAQLGTSLRLEPSPDRAALEVPALGLAPHAASAAELPIVLPTRQSLPSAELPLSWETTPDAADRGTAPAPEVSSPTSSAGSTESVPGTDDFAGEVVTSPVLTSAGYELRPEDTKVLPLPAKGGAMGVTTAAEPADVMAAKMREAFRLVEGSDSMGNPEPRGWIVAVNLTVEGLVGVPLKLMWSLDGIDIPNSWAPEGLAYELTADTNRETATAEIWVPDLTSPGTYKVNVKLVNTENNTVVAHNSSVPVPN